MIPVEHVSLDAMDMTDLGDDSAGFLFRFAHSVEDDPAHANRWFLDRVGDAAAVLRLRDQRRATGVERPHLVAKTRRESCPGPQLRCAPRPADTGEALAGAAADEQTGNAEISRRCRRR